MSDLRTLGTPSHNLYDTGVETLVFETTEAAKSDWVPTVPMPSADWQHIAPPPLGWTLQVY
jgi:hypothetical protein